MKQLVIFDLEGTLAESKSSLDVEMSELLHDLLDIVKVAVISGGDWPQFETQLLSNLPRDERLADLSLLPTAGTKFFEYNGGWEKLYSEEFSAEEKRTIIGALQQAVRTAGFEACQGLGRSHRRPRRPDHILGLGAAGALGRKREMGPRLH